MWELLSKYLWSINPIYAIGFICICILIANIIKSKLKEINGLSKRLHDEIQENKAENKEKIEKIENKLDKLQEVVYKLEGKEKSKK